MRLDTIACGPLGVNTYVVSAEDAATCAVIDPGGAAPVLERLRRSQHVFLPRRDAESCAADYRRWKRAVERSMRWEENEL
mgnify:CR=1 FL=1